MTLCLVLDTSTSICSASLYQNENLLSTIAIHQPNVHSEKAAILIHKLLKISNISIENLTHLAIAKGPGSYTGLRIGFALIKSISYGLNLPIISFSTLYGQVASYISFAQQLQKPIISCLDAGRNEIYSSIYDFNGNLIHDLGATILPNQNLENFLSKNDCIIIGNGALKIQNYYNLTSKNSIFINYIENSTTGLGNWIYQKIQNQNYENLITFEPDYLKPVNITIKKNSI